MCPSISYCIVLYRFPCAHIIFKGKRTLRFSVLISSGKPDSLAS